MGGHLIALEKCVQRMQEAVRQALKRHDTFQVHLLDADLTRTQRAWEVLCGLSDVPGAAQSAPVPTVTAPHRGAPVGDRVHQASTLHISLE